MEKIALFELSTTAIRLTLGAMVENEYFYVYKEYSEFVQINEHIEADGLIKTAKIKECIALLQIYKKICEAEGVTRMHCVVAATLAEAKNYSSFLDEANNTCGLEFKMLTDAEEISSVYTGVINTLDVPKGVIVNISSHATRIIHYNRRVVLDSLVLPYGSTSMFSGGYTCEAAIERLKTELAKKGSFLSALDPETALVGVSNVFVSFGRLSRKMRKIPVDIDHNFQADAENFRQVFDFIKGLDATKRQKLRGISSQSAEAIFAGMCIMEAILQFSKLNNIIVGCSYRNIGLMFNYAMPFTVERPVSDVLGYSLEAIAASSRQDKKECETRYNLALLLFRQLKVLHKLPRGYLKVLRIASYLYHIGKRINNFGYERINYHAILNCNINGASHKEIILAAFVAAQKKWEDFNIAEWSRYGEKFLTEDDCDAVRKLSIIVAMSEALNIRNCNAIKDISCDILGDSVILKLIADESAKVTKTDVNALHMEIFYAKKYSTEFSRAFRKNMEIL